MKTFTILAFGVAGLLAAAGPARADVRLTMHDGLVTIVAKDATVRQILEEWAKVGQTRIVNVERLTGGPQTIELSEIPEKQALDILLRSVNGYLAAPRPTVDPKASQFDRIVVMPTISQPRNLTASSAPPPPLPQPRFQLPPATQDIDDAANPNLPSDPNRPPVVNQFAPPMPTAIEPARQTPTFSPTAPVGTSAPGMVLPPPTPPAPGQQPRPF